MGGTRRMRMRKMLDVDKGDTDRRHRLRFMKQEMSVQATRGTRYSTWSMAAWAPLVSPFLAAATADLPRAVRPDSFAMRGPPARVAAETSVCTETRGEVRGWLARVRA